ncbi:unannotated protein [freshwater metagenome]|uniref:Unannotated protein n=1 Tax=freshwater metagenome TaxID=449393 RepID=A0A6J7AW83_9ZZZZ|nr:glycosyltransferase [Actinomycetota bacterium]
MSSTVNDSIQAGASQHITFVCGTPHGGALDSTVALAQCARDAGHPTTVVVAASDPYSTDRRLNAALVRLSRWSAPLAHSAWRIYERRHRRATRDEVSHFTVLRATDVVAVARSVHPAGGLVVVNSVRRLDLKRLIELAQAMSSGVVWYLREATSLVSVAELGPLVDVLLANSVPLAAEASRLAGRACEYVPSVISVDDLVEPTERRSLLLVNAVASYGLDEAIEIARRRPNDHVVLQESWPLEASDLASLRERTQALPNVEFRHRTERSAIYRDARIMLLPHAANVVGLNRPRVALEAQHLGVPVIAYNTPGLAAVVASDRCIVENDGIDGWVTAIDRIDGDYGRSVAEARSFAAQELPTNEVIWHRFAVVAGLD